MSKVYISGKISGLDYQEAFKKFEEAEKDVIQFGGVPVNPMKICGNNPDWTWEDYMDKDLAALLRCEGIYMLNNWGASKGARVEYAVAKELGLTIVFQK
jgi:hypothetical protein